MSSLYLLRHGQAAFGGDDYDQLSPLGQHQARATGAFLDGRGMVFDTILVGPRKRHQATAQAILAAMPRLVSTVRPCPVVSLDEFAEGGALLDSARQRLSVQGSWPSDSAAQKRLYGEEIRRWANGARDIPGCVPADEFCETVTTWLGEVVQAGGSGQRLLAVTSAGTIAALVRPREQLYDLVQAIDNASLSELVFSHGRISLRSFNSTFHLSVKLASRI